MERPKCPKCGMELPEMLLAAHIDGCDEEPPEGGLPEPSSPVGSIRDFIKDNPVPEDDDFLDIEGLGTMDEREGSGGGSRSIYGR